VRSVTEELRPHFDLSGPDNAGGLFLKSRDALLFLALLTAAALTMVAVALVAPVALLIFALAGGVGLNRQAKRWRTAEPV
jgi:Flp pilus assembly protein TadB